MIIRHFLALFVLSSVALTAYSQEDRAASINVMPYPASVKVSAGQLKLDAAFTVGSEGNTDPRLQRAVIRMQEQLRRRTGLAVSLGLAAKGTASTLSIVVRGEGGPVPYPKFGEDESYTLALDSTHATLNANSTEGSATPGTRMSTAWSPLRSATLMP